MSDDATRKRACRGIRAFQSPPHRAEAALPILRLGFFKEGEARNPSIALGAKWLSGFGDADSASDTIAVAAAQLRGLI